MLHPGLDARTLELTNARSLCFLRLLCVRGGGVNGAGRGLFSGVPARELGARVERNPGVSSRGPFLAQG